MELIELVSNTYFWMRFLVWTAFDRLTNQKLLQRFILLSILIQWIISLNHSFSTIIHGALLLNPLLNLSLRSKVKKGIIVSYQALIVIFTSCLISQLPNKVSEICQRDFNEKILKVLKIVYLSEVWKYIAILLYVFIWWDQYMIWIIKGFEEFFFQSLFV